MSFISLERLSELAVELLSRTIVLPATVLRVPNTDYDGSGGTVTIRVPQRRTAEPVEGALEYGNIDETPVQVEVARWYDAAKVTTDQRSLEIVSFGSQVLQPMVAAVAEAGENVLATTMNEVEATADFSDLTDAEATREDILAIREGLTTNDVPQANRTLACSPDVITGLLRIPDFVRSNESGSDSALRNAIMGRLFGLDVIESNALETGSAVGYHRSAFAFTSLAPALPDGAKAAHAVADGLALRIVYSYLTSDASDVILVDTYGGAVLTDADRVIRYGNGSS